jgi:hypothetical protein
MAAPEEINADMLTSAPCSASRGHDRSNREPVETPLIVHGAAAHIHPARSLDFHLDAPGQAAVSAPQRVTRYPAQCLSE